MITEKEIEILKRICRIELSDDFDKFDFNANIDNTLTFNENKNDIIKKIRNFKDNFKEQLEELKKGKYDNFENDFIQKNYDFNLNELFLTPKIINLVSDVNCGKSNFLYFLNSFLKEKYNFNLFTFGIKFDINDKKIYSIEELEQIKDSVILIDEFFSLFDLEDRKQRKMIEKTLRLINHNNNVIILVGVPENFKKFISSKSEIVIFGKSTISGFINGSRIKEICLNYKGVELGSNILDIPINKVLVFDGKHYKMLEIPYIKEYDSKLKNVAICVRKNVDIPKIKGVEYGKEKNEEEKVSE